MDHEGTDHDNRVTNFTTESVQTINTLAMIQCRSWQWNKLDPSLLQHLCYYITYVCCEDAEARCASAGKNEFLTSTKAPIPSLFDIWMATLHFWPGNWHAQPLRCAARSFMLQHVCPYQPIQSCQLGMRCSLTRMGCFSKLEKMRVHSPAVEWYFHLLTYVHRQACLPTHPGRRDVSISALFQLATPASGDTRGKSKLPILQGSDNWIQHITLPAETLQPFLSSMACLLCIR